MALPQFSGIWMSVGVPEVVGHGHVLQAIVWGWGWCRVGQPIAGTAALGRAQGAGPLTEVVGVQRVPV